MPQYMLLIYNPVDSPITPEQMAEMGPRWDAYTKTLADAGVLVGGDALERGGRFLQTDPPCVDCVDFALWPSPQTPRVSGSGPVAVGIRRVIGQLVGHDRDRARVHRVGRGGSAPRGRDCVGRHQPSGCG